MGRRVLRFDGALGPEGCGGGFAADYKKRGRGLRRRLCRRVVFAYAQGATAALPLRVADCRSAAMLIKSALRDLLFCVIWQNNHSADWLAALATPYPGCAGLLHGKACHTILRSLRFLTNRVPLPPLFRGPNKTPRSIPFISRSQHNGAL